MFNVVAIVGECQNCGNILNNWQTKDAEVLGKYPIENVLLILEFADLTAGNVYGSCDVCNTAIEFDIQDQEAVLREEPTFAPEVLEWF